MSEATNAERSVHERSERCTSIHQTVMEFFHCACSFALTATRSRPGASDTRRILSWFHGNCSAPYGTTTSQQVFRSCGQTFIICGVRRKCGGAQDLTAMLFERVRGKAPVTSFAKKNSHRTSLFCVLLFVRRIKIW